MQNQLRDKNDIKIFILNLLRHISRPLDFVSINDIVVQDGFVGYFDFVECFAELLETGNLMELISEESNEELYKITPQGIQVSESLESRILPAIREKSVRSAMRFLSFRERGSKIKFEFETKPNGRFDAFCIITEKDEEILRVNVAVESTAQLEKIRSNFYDKPEVVYRGIMAVLTGEVNYLIE